MGLEGVSVGDADECIRERVESLSREELLVVAADMGARVRSNMRDDTMRRRILESVESSEENRARALGLLEGVARGVLMARDEVRRCKRELVAELEGVRATLDE